MRGIFISVSTSGHVTWVHVGVAAHVVAFVADGGAVAVVAQLLDSDSTSFSVVEER